MLACFDLLIYGMGGRTHPDTNIFVCCNVLIRCSYTHFIHKTDNYIFLYISTFVY